MDMTVNIDDIRILPVISESLRRFSRAVKLELLQTQLEINRVNEEISTRVNYWKEEVTRTKDKVTYIREKLISCLGSGFTDKDGHYHTPDCSSEQLSLKQAEIYLDECLVNLNTATLWQSRFESAMKKIQVTSDHLSELCIADVDSARAYIDRTFNKLEEVQASEHAVGKIQTIAGVRDGELHPSINILSDEQQIESASTIFKEMHSIQPETWNDLDENLRAKTLQEVEDIIAVYQNRPTSHIKIKPMDSQLYGYYDGNTIYLNQSNISEKDSKNAVETILHEGRHSYQQFAIQHPWIHSDTKEVNAWRRNLRHYFDPSKYGQELYESQPVEVDARRYVEKICNNIFGKGDNEIST